MLFPNLISVLLLWIARARQRRQLRTMETWQLDDLGISREDAFLESRKPCWRA